MSLNKLGIYSRMLDGSPKRRPIDLVGIAEADDSDAQLQAALLASMNTSANSALHQGGQSPPCT